MPQNTETDAQAFECPFFSPSGRVVSNKRTKAEVLRHYAAHKEPTYFLQFDGFNPSDFSVGDEDGDDLFRRGTYELMHGSNVVRVLATPGAKAAVAAPILRRIGDWIEQDPDSIPGCGDQKSSREE